MTVLLHSYVLLYRCKATHDGGRRRILILEMLAAGLLGDSSTSTNRTTMQPSEERYDIPRANFLRECSGIPRYGKHLNVFEDRRCTRITATTNMLTARPTIAENHVHEVARVCMNSASLHLDDMNGYMTPRPIYHEMICPIVMPNSSR
jgi:hypothetical protein